MGHVRVGRLPHTVNWLRVTALIADSPDAIPRIAAATVHAAERQLRELADNHALNYSFWLLTRIATAARGDSFERDLARLGLDVRTDTSTLRFSAQLADHVRAQNVRFGLTNHVDELAALALRGTLSETIGAQGVSLFDAHIADVQRAFRLYSRDRQFGVLARRFFGNFLGRTLRFILDREIPNQVGKSPGFATLSDAAELNRSVNQYAHESARIMQDFAVDWYGKNNWKTCRSISREQAHGFVAHALDKLREELKQGAPAL